jgi:transposase
MKKIFIGIDFSKGTFDVSLLEGERKEMEEKTLPHVQLENSEKGYAALSKWVKSNTAAPKEAWLFCGEHTGLYSIGLATFLLKKGLFVWLENPLQIKLSSGIRREKSDKVDSRDIAWYACRFCDRAKAFRLPGKALSSLQHLLAFRERLVKNKVSLQVAAQEMRRVYRHDSTARFIYEHSVRETEQLEREIDAVEKKMMEIIKASEELAQNYHLAVSVKGIGMINAIAIMVHTQNFTTFENSRQFSCYAGMAPFEDSSGSSRNRGKHVRRTATDKQMKALLTQAARAAVIHDGELREYHQRKLAEGKLEKVVINNVRNKLLHRIFAVVRKKQAFQNDYMNTVKMLQVS